MTFHNFDKWELIYYVCRGRVAVIIISSLLMCDTVSLINHLELLDNEQNKTVMLMYYLSSFVRQDIISKIYIPNTGKLY